MSDQIEYFAAELARTRDEIQRQEIGIVSTELISGAAAIGALVFFKRFAHDPNRKGTLVTGLVSTAAALVTRYECSRERENHAHLLVTEEALERFYSRAALLSTIP
jgi:hypothetical protein